jgi:NAD(P)-dependent dehydrogenase (short-subunit alcohol dehydrogenase family)
MGQFEGKVAVITGAASGIGRGMAEAFAGAGMKLVLGDVEQGALTRTAERFEAAGHDVLAVVTDVGDRVAVEALAREAIARYGKVHVLCNNAGIAAGGGPIWESPLEDWEWILDVNLKSVLYGIRAFVPHMLEHGEPAHVVNTASLAGLICGGDSPAYSVTKHGVVALSENLYLQLSRTGKPVSASVLCPAWVNTQIADSERNRPADRRTAGGAGEPARDPAAQAMEEWVRQQLREGLDPRNVGETVLQAIRDDRFYILTHPDWSSLIETRFQNILSGKNPQTVMPPGAESLLEQLARAGVRR